LRILKATQSHFRSRVALVRSLQLSSTFGIVVLCADAPRTLIAARRGSPLLVGVGDDKYIVSSDASAIITHTSHVVYLEDNEIVTLDPTGMHVATIDAAPVGVPYGRRSRSRCR
jgi:glucosamine 6-phosphate synthetase-like amidotransferase/phosphosugar isomerase protein